MPFKKTLLCLANSTKPSGFCFAGKEATGKWVRPVSNRTSGGLSSSDENYQDGAQPQLLDVVEIDFLNEAPKGHQTENALIDQTRYWVLKKKASSKDALKSVDTVKGSLWQNGDSSSNGLNDRIEAALAAKNKNSLLLLKPVDLVVHVKMEGAGQEWGGRKTRATFEYNGTSYKFKLTDPVAQQHYLAKGVGSHEVENALICVSLGEPFNGYVYKLVASIIHLQQ